MPFEKGNKYGQGRPSKVDEEKANVLFIKAIKEIYDKTIDDEAKIEFIKTLVQSPRGEMFVAEHIFGKPKEVIDMTTNNISSYDLSNLTDDELDVLTKLYARNHTSTDDSEH